MINRYGEREHIERSNVQREIKSKDRDRIWVERHRCRGETNRDKLIDTKILRD